ncbi:hypothetical protein K1719_021633 [Acacia pycnantha]|nr:hypothetical protein K1719_021633 [Acacia pycnantha]
MRNLLAAILWRYPKWICSSKLVKALSRVLRQGSSSTAKPHLGHSVHEVANRVLAVIVKGNTQWSQVILAFPLSRIKFQRQHKN